MSQETMQKYTLIVSSMASFLSPFMSNAVSLAIPSIGKGFYSNAILLSWVVTSYILISAVVVLPSGRLGDIWGRKRIFVIGLAIFAISSLLCANAWSIQSLIVFRITQGMGAAMSYSTATAIVSSVFPPHKRGKALGIITTATYIGFAMGPVLGGVLTYNLGWRSIFYFGFLAGGIVLALTVSGIDGEWAEAKGESFDKSGTALYMIGMVAFIYGLSCLTTEFRAKFILMIGIVAMALFVWHELVTDQPLLNIRFFSGNVTFVLANLAALIYFITTSSVNYLLSLHLQMVVGFDSQIAGLILLSQPLVMAILSPWAGTLSDSIEPRVVATCGIALATIGLAIFSFINSNMAIWILVVNLILLGSGAAFFSSPNTNSIMGSIPRQFYGVASSTLGTMRNTGQAISMATVALIINYYVGKTQLGASSAYLLEKSIRTAFVVFAITCLLGILASLTRGNFKTFEKKV